MAPRKTIQLDQDWAFRQADDLSAEFLAVQRFPTEIHLDLRHHGLIPDPFPGKNEGKVQWVGEKSWTYRNRFTSPDIGKGEKALLAFDGLDTYATVLLNGVEILKTQSMFIPERVDVTETLLAIGQNTLDITFESAYLIGKKVVEKYPDHLWSCSNGDRSRLAVRKAQYHYVKHPHDLP